MSQNMRIRVTGGQALNGTYRPSGNSNAAIMLIAAAMLTGETSTLHNIPQTTGIDSMLAIAARLGATSARSADSAQTLRIEAAQILHRVITSEETSGFTGALLYLAPILVRREFARLEVDFPLNRIRPHLEALRDLGFDVVNVDGSVEVRPSRWAYKDVILTQSSVTATAIVMMLAACFGKETVIRNAASEPHLQQLAEYLELMGAQIHGTRSNVLHIFGKEGDLNGVDYHIATDHIEAASVAAMGALCGGRVHIVGTQAKHMRMIDRFYRRLGIHLDIADGDIFVPQHDVLSVSNREEDVDSSIETAPWPGFPSDLVAIATVIATQARGTSLIHEKLYNNRLLFVDKLKSMGAQIVLCDPHRAIVMGKHPLHAIYMDSPDVRSGLGMLAAALVADGESVIDNAQALRRSFDGVVTKLTALGAQVVIESA
ncbi:MAG: UDP-N-acetylglucosamine 1-carboxyvinyltransferase [Anaerolineaceae bacterium]|nr:MAG: UDP-N-acetylglucosamine 1-carboxyvinyltransferase [Anaerolineaceae bacterium]